MNRLLKIFLLLCFVLPIVSFKPADDGEAIFKKMYKTYHGKWFKTFTFNQTTEIYRNDSLVRTQTWYEYVHYPDRFRIDFGVRDSGNAVIFKGDSAYRIRKGNLVSVTKDANDLTFLLGGMYFYPYDKLIEKVKGLGYDLTKVHEDVLKGTPVYVIGAAKGDEKSSQLWIDKKRLILLRFITYGKNGKEEGFFENHIKLNGGWSETKCTFYFGGKLAQIEKYHDCKANVPIDEKTFEPR
jgi:outer membrane lipoprotein-sorting protein